LQEIYRLQKQNKSIIGKVAELWARYNELYHEFVCSSTKHIDTLEEKMTSLDKFMDDIFKIEYQKDKLIESLLQEILAKENVFSALTNEVKQLQQEKVKCDEMCDTSDLIQKIDSSGDSCFLVDDNNVDVHISLSLVWSFK
jgi:predicted nuclease with TOPRIM domain